MPFVFLYCKTLLTSYPADLLPAPNLDLNIEQLPDSSICSNVHTPENGMLFPLQQCRPVLDSALNIAHSMGLLSKILDVNSNNCQDSIVRTLLRRCLSILSQYSNELDNVSMPYHMRPTPVQIQMQIYYSIRRQTMIKK